MPDFLRRDDVAAVYEQQTGYAPRDLDFYTLLAALRHGIVMFRISRRALHRRMLDAWSRASTGSSPARAVSRSSPTRRSSGSDARRARSSPAGSRATHRAG